MNFNPRIQLGILLLCLSFNLHTCANTTVYQILTKYSLPQGILPNSVKAYTLSEDGTFEVVLEKPCYVEFEYLVYYAEKISGKLSIGSITELGGIQVKRFLFWLNVNEIRVDFPSSGSIYFQVGIINKKLDVKQFETVHTCRDNALALCGSSLRHVLQLRAPVDNMEMLITE
ncbi:hypothetical protein RND71_002124 [Anisodus tanguticus]|uniref:Uncharacterized protein n=1 Tax=Anisodus tanguticus TaxID=243964 RepID=A0AAE1T221_9SOLA|nr:hypothetical protein RND71_002124 [Anisodus tanguticus]